MSAYLHPASVGGRAYLAPAEAPAVTDPPSDEDFDITTIPADRRVIFAGGVRLIAYAGGTRTVRF